MTTQEPDYTYAVEDPTPSATDPTDSPLIQNMRRAVEENPGEWVRVATYPSAQSASSVASDLRTGRRTKRRPPGRWEFKAQTLEDGRGGVYAKWLGPQEEPEDGP